MGDLHAVVVGRDQPRVGEPVQHVVASASGPVLAAGLIPASTLVLGTRRRVSWPSGPMLTSRSRIRRATSTPPAGRSAQIRSASAATAP